MSWNLPPPISAYPWSSDDDDVALDAIIIGIGSDAAVFAVEGLDFGDVQASVYWPERMTQGDLVRAGLEGPYTVPEAIERANQLRELWNYDRIVIAIQDRSLWRSEWGRLREDEGFDDAT